MFYSAARVATERPDRYVRQLVSHLGHEVQTDLAAEGRGTITLSRGACALVPSAGRIDMIAKAGDVDGLASVEDVVGRHLLRFATHDEFTVDWAPLVRPAATTDDAALLALDTTAWTPGSGFPSYLSKPRTSFFGEEKAPEHCLVAQIGGEVVGYVGVLPKFRLPEAAHVFVVRGLAVAAGARRLGVASALLSASERSAADRGATKLSLQVLGGNAAAMALYERHGYVVEGRSIDEFLIDGRYVDDVTMAKML
ncbi:MAG TPA: GNAT family N-acetyltransferase [Rugosimonospora sp.]|jgi:L-amino acid N-acyltransferase YncA